MDADDADARSDAETRTRAWSELSELVSLLVCSSKPRPENSELARSTSASFSTGNTEGNSGSETGEGALGGVDGGGGGGVARWEGMDVRWGRRVERMRVRECRACVLFRPAIDRLIAADVLDNGINLIVRPAPKASE